MASSQSELVNCHNILTIDECKEIVCKTINVDNVNVIKYEINADQNVFGYLGEYFRLTVYVENNTSETPSAFRYFIKSLPINDGAQRKYIESYGMFKKEGLLYKELFSKLDGVGNSSKWRPNCYLARSDLLVLEDLNLIDFTHLRHGTAFQVEHVECGLRSIAKMASASIAYDTNKLKDSSIGLKFKDLLVETSIGLDNAWYLVGMEAVKAIAPLTPNFSKYKDWSHQKFDELIAPIYDMNKESKTFRNVVCHRDLWQNNLLFKFERSSNDEINYNKPTECILIDFQICRYLPPIIDVHGFISVTTRRKHRKQYFQHYLRFYYDQLEKELIQRNLKARDVLSWDEFQTSSEKLKMLPLVINCACRPLIAIPSAILISLKSENPERYMRTMTVNRHEFILEQMELNSEYKEVVLETYGELLDCMFGLGNEN